MAVGDKSHLNNYKREVTPAIVNPHGGAMSFSGAASVPKIINSGNPHGGAMNFSGSNTVNQIKPDVAMTQDGMTVPINQGTSSVFDYSMPSGDDRAAYEKAMADTYANVVTNPGVNIFGIDVGKTTGYTGQGSQSMAGIRRPGGNTSPNTSPSGGGGGGAQSTGPAPIPQVLLSQNLTQRPQTGNIYAPDLSAYNDSSLFNYAGPGGVDEYTYGQGLPYEGAGYDIWGSPTDIANPYYEGQYAPTAQPESVGPADSAITMPAVQLPDSVPQIINNTIPAGIAPISATTPAPGDLKDLNYAEHLAEMGINPADAPSTTFPSPGESNLSLAERQAKQMGTDNWDAMVAQADAMDKQLREGQLSSYDPYKGEAELNKDVGKLGTLPTDSSMLDNQLQADMAMGDRLGYQDSERFLARDVAKGMNDNLTELMAKGQVLQDKYDAQERVQTKDRVLDQQFDRNQAEYTPTLSDYYPNATPMQFAKTAGDEGFTPKIGPKTGPSGLTTNDVISDGDSENIFQTQDVEADAYQRALDKERYQTQINNPTADFSGYMKNYGSGFKEPQASLSDVTDSTPMQFANNASQMETRNANIFNEGKTGFSGKNATDVKIENADKVIENMNRPFRERADSFIPSLALGDVALRLLSGGDVTDNAIAAHRANKEENWGGGLKHYKDENLQMLDGSIYNPVSDATDGYHFRSGKDAGKLSGNQDLTLGGLPMAAGSWLYQQANGLLDGTLGSNANKQAIDNMQGLIASGNAPAVKTLFDNVAAGKARDASIKKEIAEKTFTPRVVAPKKKIVSKPKSKVAVKSKPVRTPVVKASSVTKTYKPSRTPTKPPAIKVSHKPKAPAVSSGPSRRSSRGSSKKATKKTTSTFSRYGKKGGW